MIKKQIVSVLGVPRSGTSAISRGLTALNINFGEHLLEADEKWNAKGFWEDKDIVYSVNRKISSLLGETWTSIKRIDHLCYQNKALETLRSHAQNILHKRLDKQNCWGFKDPRTARVLPFWQEIFQELSLDEYYVITLRNPLACASSWQRLNGSSIETGLLLWLAHIIPALENTHHKRRIIVSFEEMLTNSHKQLARIKQVLTFSQMNLENVDCYANTFLDKKLRHFEFDEEAFHLHPASSAIPLCAKVYDLLKKTAKDEIEFSSSEFTAHWQMIMQEYHENYPLYCYIDSLLKSNKEYERHIRTIRKSVPWRLIYPLRVIDDKLRALRITKRNKV